MTGHDGRGAVMMRAAMIAVMFVLAGAGAAVADTRNAQKIAAEIRVKNCQGCHGPLGDSTTPEIPRLNGQAASYLFTRLHSLRYPIREAPRAIHDMGEIVPQLQSQVIAALANYYADQAPTKPLAMAGASSEGARLYKFGAGKDVPACAGCHGVDGEGRGNAPRLAGQRADYLELQLRAFGLSARIADPMNRHVWLMTPEQMRAVATYLGG